MQKNTLIKKKTHHILNNTIERETLRQTKKAISVVAIAVNALVFFKSQIFVLEFCLVSFHKTFGISWQQP